VIRLEVANPHSFGNEPRQVWQTGNCQRNALAKTG
jgi:hypothetical protein